MEEVPLYGNLHYLQTGREVAGTGRYGGVPTGGGGTSRPDSVFLHQDGCLKNQGQNSRIHPLEGLLG